jgi:hypothetical protein
MIAADPSAALYALLYVLDEAELTEHGSSVPGWLTEKGKAWLQQYREYAERFPEQPEQD